MATYISYDTSFHKMVVSLLASLKIEYTDLDTTSDPLDRAFFKIDSVEYTLRTWNIEDHTQKGIKCVKVDYSIIKG